MIYFREVICIYFFYLTVDTLLKKVGLHAKSKVIDLTRKCLTVESLTESKIMCSVQDKVCLRIVNIKILFYL